MNIEQEIQALKDRNARVEADKAWETSGTRGLLLLAITYIVAVVTFIFIKNDHPFLNAIIPTVAFSISLQTIPPVKRWWLKKRK